MIVPLKSVPVGTRVYMSREVMPGGLYATVVDQCAGSVVVDIDGPPKTRSFEDKRTGRTVSFTSSGERRTRWSQETTVEVLR